jgi:uncharacterized protein YndB with AHSA1/START domain
MSSAEPSMQPQRVSPSAVAMPGAPVRKSVTVKASPQRAFDVFTADFDRWWPRSHHIGQVPMQRAVIEGRVGGRCYSQQTDGTECAWGEITEWEPPRRFLMAWKITAQWHYEPDLSKCSEVEVRFTPLENGSTRVDLEHRNFERIGAGWETMRAKVEAEGGWSTLMQLFAAEVEKTN